MNRRQFHQRTALTLAGMAAGVSIPGLAAIKDLVPTGECGHKLRDGIRCMRQVGHDWEHRAYEQYDSGHVDIHEWNDGGVIWRPQEYGAILEPLPLDEHAIAVAVEAVKRSAEVALGPGRVYELRSRNLAGRRSEEGGEFNGLTPGIAWYWKPAPSELPDGFNPEGRTLKQDGLFEVHPFDSIQKDGYDLFGRVKT